MRVLTTVLISIFGVLFCSAQIHEIGGYVGGSNFIGDVGATNYIDPNQLVVGGIYKWNRSTRHAYRASLLFSNLEGIDRNSDDPRRIARDYAFKNQIIELSAGIEYTFFEYDLHDGNTAATPYLYTGITVTHHDNFYFSQTGVRVNENTSSFAYGIPMVIGFKTTFSSRLILGVEIGARYTFSDELDGSVPDSEALIETLSFGNTNNNDWYMFTGLTVTYTFGQNPCFCIYEQ
ncbi:MAG TPA: DUF6089 family protein [Flavobacteriaceae bacterium]|nr:DUF6089 family protein [Flavobacteriaceae bacterium]